MTSHTTKVTTPRHGLVDAGEDDKDGPMQKECLAASTIIIMF